ncbi:hypothetical protein AK812_SmicGene11137 [Symbiodinium microadriaticum]|uniref:Uncharacterized protein n=1 Tax=Symbiodinium microadriaticum TaxID=2951 RepID=A0A1Q9EDY7_SYMMI|nr:hypothetical protein AK812_SmicGene11137 [Symbiodinium microadriaticum]
MLLLGRGFVTGILPVAVLVAVGLLKASDVRCSVLMEARSSLQGIAGILPFFGFYEVKKHFVNTTVQPQVAHWEIIEYFPVTLPVIYGLATS